MESLKNYVNTLLCLGIFVTMIQLVMPKNNLRKYIYSLTGIILVIAIISPVVNVLKNTNVETGISQVIASIDEYDKKNKEAKVDIDLDKKYKINSDKMIENEMSKKIKEDIKSKLEGKNIKVKEITVYLEDDYNVKKIYINIDNLENENSDIKNVNEIIKYINEEYKIDYSKIEVVEEGKNELS